MISVHSVGTSAVGENFGGFQRIIIDTKAMRKFRENDSLYAAIETVETGVATLKIHFDSRVLALLP